jgi:hypothetical protein
MFKKSVEKKFKVAVSLYYIASISEELKDYKTATSFYTAVNKIKTPEAKKVLQAALARVADIYLMQAKKQANASEVIENYVIPQYHKAYAIDKKSSLGSELKQKIEELQRRYELVLFKLRNGRPTARPPYFYKLNLITAYSDNVNQLDEDNIEAVEDDDKKAFYNTVSFFGRHTFYPNSSYSVSPQINAGYTKYHSDSDSIKVLNNYFVTPALQLTWEHFYQKRAATFYVNLDYTYSADDSDNDDTVEKSSNTQNVTFSEQLQFITYNPTILRYRYTTVSSEAETLSNITHSFILEQMYSTKFLMYYFYLNYSMATYDENESLDSNDIIFRTDFIFKHINGITPNLYYSRVIKDYTEDVNSDRAYNTLGLNLSKKLTKNWFTYIDYSRSFGESSVEDSNFTSQLIQFSIDYVF